MDILIKTKEKANELHLKIQEYLKELARVTDKAKHSQEMLRYLNFCSNFWSYSLGNIFLIMLAKPQATFVAGFHKWKIMGRWVRKGECGIPILAPILVKEEDQDGIETQHLVGFKVVYVFDVSQTDGEPLPPEPDWKSPEKNHKLNQRLVKYAESQGIKVSLKKLPGDIQGASLGGVIEIDPGAGTKTLVHEIAHELMHKEKDNFQSRATKELQAESVAYIVCTHFGLEGLKSPNYLAFFEVTSEQILAHMEIIRNTASKIITAIDPIS